MKVLIVGSGGREHALAWALKSSPQVEKLYCAPGNAGIAKTAECVPIKAEELEKLADFAAEKKIDLTVVGPEAPLCAGIADVFLARGLRVFGPDKRAAMLEGSKDFAKAFMLKYGIPTARGKACTDAASARAYIRGEFSSGARGIVVKADGLAAGKGVLVARSEEEALAFSDQCFEGEFGSAGSKVVIEEMLSGEEASIFALCDGKTITALAPAQDHKRIFDNDEGPNTGGMGAYSPAPVVNDVVARRIDEKILEPFLRGVQQEKLRFRGVIFVGLMIENDEPKVLEFNVRFGDPETQPVMRRFEGDLADVLFKTATGDLEHASIGWKKTPAVSVVIASGGYPGKYEKGKPISGLEAAEAAGTVVFHAGTAEKDGKIVTAGGRVLGVSATGETIADAIANAYRGVEKISFDGAFFRKDIGAKALKKR